MVNPFFERPILNSPYRRPDRHWILDESGRPTGEIEPRRRPASFLIPIPKPRKIKRGSGPTQEGFVFDEGHRLSTREQQYATAEINGIRRLVEAWRGEPSRARWMVTAETARLLVHWRTYPFRDLRPFYCQIEAAETAIWLTEVAPRGKAGRRIIDQIAAVNRAANPDLSRMALKLATGAGKTTVMAMLIAWQTLNALRTPDDPRFTRSFVVVTPGLTIRDRLRVLSPNDPESYFRHRDLVPTASREGLDAARIVITNYHAFARRERVEISSGGRALLQGRGERLDTRETEGQMVHRVLAGLGRDRNVLVLNDEAHHCYREKAGPDADEPLTGDDRKEAAENTKAARLWISGLEAIDRAVGVSRVIDLSATPFFLRGSGYAEGTLFPWTVSDFSLMDAIEAGIVKLPRVPVAENIPGDEMPVYRDLWARVRGVLPKATRGATLDPLKLPTQLQTALQSLYGHYEKTFERWRDAGHPAPPCFIIVCQNTAISKLVYEYVSGFARTGADGSTTVEHGRLALFRNFDPESDLPLARPNTLLIDSRQIEAGDALDDGFRAVAADEIERFRREIVERARGGAAAEAITDQELLREVLNTVGKPGQLGGSIRCVVSVSMLTEGWDANTVTHVLGLRAFGTQLLCEQVMGRALRRQSYELNADGLLNAEYADILGVPFDFTAEPVIAPVQPPRAMIQVKAVRPDRDALEIAFPRVEGYRVELPSERLSAAFDDDSTLVVTPDLVGPTVTQLSGIVGESIDLTVEHLGPTRSNELLYRLTKTVMERKFRDPGEPPRLDLFGQLKRITRDWLDHHLVCRGQTHPGLLLSHPRLADAASERISAGITRAFLGERPVRAIVDPYNPTGSTRQVRFQTSARTLWAASPAHCHLNWIVCDSEWEAEFCRAVERHPRVVAYVKNHNLGLEVPYAHLGEARRYRPDFVVLIDDGHGPADPLRLVVEIKGERGEDDKVKRATIETSWVPGVNRLGTHGRWAFAEFTDVYEIQRDLADRIDAEFARFLDAHAPTGGR